MGPPIMLIPFPLLTRTNRVSDISPAKMGLFSISRELQFEVCICGEPSVSPQSARAGEHFYRGEEEVGRALTESKAFHCLCPCQERRGVFLLPLGHCCCCNLMYQTFRGFLLGTTWDLHSVVVMTALCLGRLCPVQSITDPLSIPGRCSLHVFSLLSQG